MQPPPHARTAVRALLESTGTSFRVVHYTPASVIFCQGDACDTVMHIETGRVWLAVSTPSGKEAISGILGPEAFLGEEVMAGCTLRPHTATAMTATEVLAVAKPQMAHLLATQPTLSSLFLRHTLQRQIRLETDLVDQLLSFSEQRLAHTLLALAGCDERHRDHCALPHVSQELMAEMVGTTRSRVNLFMQRFKKFGFIQADGTELRVNPDCLGLVSGENQRRPRRAPTH